MAFKRLFQKKYYKEPNDAGVVTVSSLPKESHFARSAESDSAASDGPPTVAMNRTYESEVGRGEVITASVTDRLAFSGMGQPEDGLKVIIVGTGFAGLSAAIACLRQGFQVTIVERSSGLSPHGDSISFGANASKILFRWGLGPELWDRSSRGAWWLFHDKDGRVIHVEDLRSYPEKFESPLLHGPRNLYLGTLGVEARTLGAQFHYNAEVVDYIDSSVSPGICLASGETLFGDVVIVADGIRSRAKTLVERVSSSAAPSVVDAPTATTEKYRYAVHRAKMKVDPTDVAKWSPLADGCIRTWVGDDVSATVSAVDHGKEMTFYLTHPNHGENASVDWRDRRDIKETLTNVAGWDPVLCKALSNFKTALNWKIIEDQHDEDWVSAGGKIVFIGDSVHPLVPSSFQGGSQSVEDAAALALCLALVKPNKRRIPLALHVFQNLRLPRVKRAAQIGVQQRQIWEHITPDIPLSPLTTQMYGYCVETTTLETFESLAQTYDAEFSLAPDTLKRARAHSGIDKPLPFNARSLFFKMRKPVVGARSDIVVAARSLTIKSDSSHTTDPNRLSPSTYNDTTSSLSPRSTTSSLRSNSAPQPQAH